MGMKLGAAAMMLACALPPAAATGGDALAACRLPEMQILRDVGLGFPRIPYRLGTTGEVHFRVLFVDFDDVPAQMKPEELMAIVSPRAEQFFSAVSYGRMKLVFDPLPRWIRMGKPAADYHFGRGAPFEVQQAYMQEALDRAGAQAVDEQTDAVLVMANPAARSIDWGPGFAALPGTGLRAGTRTFLNGATSGSDLPVLGWAWFAHEIGHVMSLVDLAGPLPGSQLWHTYVGDFSVMGNPTGLAPEYLGWERWQLGWLDDGQVSCMGGAQGKVRLTPIERAGGMKLLVVPTGPNTAVAVESRRPEGFDSRLPRSGPLVYQIDTRLSTHDGAIRVFPVDDDDTHHWQSLLRPGGSVTVGNVAITLRASDADGDTVEFIRSQP